MKENNSMGGKFLHGRGQIFKKLLIYLMKNKQKISIARISVKFFLDFLCASIKIALNTLFSLETKNNVC